MAGLSRPGWVNTFFVVVAVFNGGNIMNAFCLKGNIVYAEAQTKLNCTEQGYLVCEGGLIAGVYCELPERYKGIEVRDCGDGIIIPSFADMHLHAPQFPMLGMGMDLELIDWLNKYTFPTEARFSDTGYAKAMYAAFADELVRVGTTRACIFGTIHTKPTLGLMEILESKEIKAYVGKVNMDRNSPVDYCETTQQSINATLEFLDKSASFKNIKPIITPRFTPSCSDELRLELGRIAHERGLYVQSHLNESLSEIEWVKELCPGIKHYYESYLNSGLFNEKTLMAHCVHMTDDELFAMSKHGVWAVHCPDSNINLASGIAPVRRMLDAGVKAVLGSDIAGGAKLSMMQVATCAIGASKLKWRNDAANGKALTFIESFYLATSAGAEYFGSGAGFHTGDALHALVLSDSMLENVGGLSLENRLERIFYLAPTKSIVARYSEGKLIG